MKREKLGKHSQRKTGIVLLISEKIHCMTKSNVAGKTSNYIVIKKEQFTGKTYFSCMFPIALLQNTFKNLEELKEKLTKTNIEFDNVKIIKM